MRERSSNGPEPEMAARDSGQEASMETIANNLGVSISTVSRALRDNRVISAATRRRVKEAAHRLGYRPNPLIATLMTHIRDVNSSAPEAGIAFLETCDTRTCGHAEFADGQAFEAARVEGRRSGYTVDRFHLPAEPKCREHLFDVLRAKRIYGIVLASCPNCIARNDGFSGYQVEFAMAAIGGSSEGHRLHCASPDYFAGIRRGLTELGKRGYRRIGLALKAATDQWTGERYSAAFLQWSQTRPLAERIPLFVTAALAGGSFRRWYLEYQPEALLFADEEIPELLGGCDLRERPPAALASLNWSPRSVAVVGVRQNHEGVAAAAVSLVIGELIKNRRGSSAHRQAILIPPEWVPGEPANPRPGTRSEFLLFAPGDDRQAVCSGTS